MSLGHDLGLPYSEGSAGNDLMNSIYGGETSGSAALVRDIYGGGGPDKIWGNRGDDRLMADDGRHDEIRCGDGEDYVYADSNDLVYYGCETIKIVRSR